MKDYELVKKIIKNDKIKFLRWLFIFFISNLFLLISGYILGSIFKYYEESYNNQIWIVISLFLISLLMRIVFVYLNSIISAECRFLVSNGVRKSFFSAILNKPAAEKESNSNGKIINSFVEDSDEVRDYIESWINCITFCSFGLVAIIVLCTINVKMLCLTFTPVILLIFISKWIMKKIAKYRYKNRMAVGTVTGFIENIFTNVLTIKLYGAEEQINDKFYKLNKDRTYYSILDNVLRKVVTVVSYNSVSFGTAIVMLSMVLSIDSEYSLSEFVVFTYYMTFISMSLQYISEIFVERKRVQISMENIKNNCRYFELGKFENDYTNEKKSTGLESLKIENLRYEYDTSNFRLDNINLNINKGEVVVISGKIGSGKTTLIRSILGNLDSNGSVYWNSDKCDDLRDYCQSKKVSYSPQVPHFHKGTIKSNIILDRNFDAELFDKVINYSQLRNDINSMENLEEQFIGADGKNISGGQKQRLSIARMLYSDADLYVIDDVSSALDIKTSKRLFDKILKDKEKTFIIVSNMIDIVKSADKVVFMNEGKINSIGKYDELIQVNIEFKEVIQ